LAQLTAEGLVEFITGELCRNRGIRVGPDDPLVADGLISSLDLVRLAVYVETVTGVRLDPSRLGPGGLDTAASIAAAVSVPMGEAPSRIRASFEPGPLSRAFRGRLAVRIVVLAAMVFFLDRGLFWLAESGPLSGFRNAVYEHGSRLYTTHGYFADKYFPAGVRKHLLSAARDLADRFVILFFGDSGTFGSFLPAVDSLPTLLESALKTDSPPAAVYNLAYYIPTLFKEAALLELTRERRRDLVILTVDPDYFDRRAQMTVINDFDILHANVPYIEDYLDRLPAHTSSGLTEYRDRLHSLYLGSGSWIPHLAGSRSGIIQHGAFFRQILKQTPLFPLTPDAVFQNQATTQVFARQDLSAAIAHMGRLYNFGPSLDPALLNLLTAIVEAESGRGARVVIYLRPAARLKSGELYPWSRAAYARMIPEIRAACERGGGVFIDAHDLLPQSEFLDSRDHFTREGNRIQADFLADELRTRGIRKDR
jgi:acyl carrier protein